MEQTAARAIAIVGVGAVLPDAPDAPTFWQNLCARRYSIAEVPPERWRIEDYYDPDPAAPDKTYSKIGGWVRGFGFPWKQYRIPPRVAAAMDDGQKWAVAITAEVLADYGYPERPLDLDRTAVIVGTAMAGEMHYLTALRIAFPEFARALESVTEFRQLAPDVQSAILRYAHERMGEALPPITEDSMPGELANVVSGRIANVFNLRGPNFTTDAACASSLAAIAAGIEMLVQGHCDAVLTGGIDHNMGASSFVKFSKIGALSATGTRPYGEGADGFVMGEGGALFLLKRLADAEVDGDKIYAVIRGVGGSSDGRGKSITAPNPIGQQLAIRRAWQNAGLDPRSASLIEGHGTSTAVGDVVEVESLASVICDAPRGSIALGSAKSNIGHLKGGAGAAGLLKSMLALYHKTLPPTLNVSTPNRAIDFAATPFYLSDEAHEWPASKGTPRRCGVSAFGFGGTNFHLVLEEHVPGALTQGSRSYVGAAIGAKERGEPAGLGRGEDGEGRSAKLPLRGIVALGGQTVDELGARLQATLQRVQGGWTPPREAPAAAELSCRERLVLDFGDRVELLERLGKAQKALAADNPQVWKALQAQGIFRGRGPAPGKLAFLFSGQGSQYLNMGRELAALEPIVGATFAQADQVMTPLLGKPLTSYVFVDSQDADTLKQAEKELQQTAITQPAVLTLDTALSRLLGEYGFRPDMVMGHSLGEYAALIEAGVMSFADTVQAAAARGREMTRVSMDDNGWMAAVMAPEDVVRQTLAEIDGYVVPANINSHGQCVIGGASQAVERAIAVFQGKGYQAQRIPVSHAFHTAIVAPAAAPLRQVLDRLHVEPPRLPLVGNVTGQFYPDTADAIRGLLEEQIASPVQWVKGLETLYAAGVRTFVEVGPKKALKGFVDDVLGDRPEVVALFSNHPKVGEVPSFNQALCGLYAAGYAALTEVDRPVPGNDERQTLLDQMASLVRLVSAAIPASGAAPERRPYDRNETPLGSVVITGTGLGLPGAEKAVMDPDNARRILRGEQFVDLIPERFRRAILRKRITRVVKSEDGGGRFETIEDPGEVLKLAGRPGSFDLAAEYGVPEKLVEALDITTQLAMAAGLDALAEAGIPLVQTYKRTTTGKYLPDRWLLPEALRDETGVVFASAFPGGDRLVEEVTRYYVYQNRCDQLAMLEDLRQYVTDDASLYEIDRRVADLHDVLEREPYQFDRRFLFRVLSMGHSQFAEYIGARGPNTQVNAACASTAQAIALAEDWIRSGRCRRVIVIAADDVTGNSLLEWVGAGFLATGAAATDDRVEEAAIPFDRRRHGTIMGMGACALVVESEDAVRERGMRGIVELLSSETCNSAFHGTRLDVEHIAQVMNSLLTSAERRFGLNRYAIAGQTVFVSHETFTPARGGSAAAEVEALRRTFGSVASEIVVANTKGFSGHPMGVGVEDVIAAKILEQGIVPPVPNFREVDPDLGPLNLSRGGRYPVLYAIHLAAGFGSQIAMTFTRRIPGVLDRVDHKTLYQRWLAEVAGYDRAETEIVKRVLRIVDAGTPPRSPAPSTWQYGIGPSVRAEAPGSGPAERRPAPMALPPRSRTTSLVAPRPEGLAAGSQPLAPGNGHGAAPAPSEVVASPRPDKAPVETATPAPAQTPSDPVRTRVLSLVAEKTGYPEDMLDLDLDLEADLGIDTVKQAETFAAIRQTFEIPRQEGLKLRDYPTLAHVIKFVCSMRPDLVAKTNDAGTVGTAGQPSLEALSSPAVTTANASSPAATDPVTGQILRLVAEKTGYPEDMLDLDLDLEADLGIDTVKQAETFAAIRQTFDIPTQENLKLRDYPTLAHVIGFVRNMRPDLVAPEQDLAPAAGQAPHASPAQSVALSIASAASLAEADRIPRRVPTPELRPSLAFCKPTGVTLDQSSRIVVMSDGGGVGQALAEGLAQRGVAVLGVAVLGVAALAIDEPGAAKALAAQVKEWLAAGPVHGVYWLPALDLEPDFEDLDLAAWRAANQVRVKNLYCVMRALVEGALGEAVSGPGTFLVSATRLGGLHGYEPAGATGPLGGAVAGFTKAYKRERPEALVKVVDFEVDATTEGAASRLIAETLFDPGIVEVGYRNGLRYGIGLREAPAADGQPGMSLTAETVFLVTGAAGGITSAIVADLAAASRGTFYLFDLVPAPSADDPQIALLRADREALKQSLIETLKAAGERPTPAKIDRQILAVERSEAALGAVEAVTAAGGTVCYHSVDLLDAPAVAAVVDEIRQRHGRIDVVLHAAGIEVSRGLADKEPKEFDRVFDVKAEGLFNLIQAAKGLPIAALVAFSSVAGRFGNSGQTDYSAANDLLCKIVSSMRRWRPETRAIAIDWTAWADIGMATRGSLPKIMQAAGIDMLPAAAGVPTIRRELTYGGTQGEVLVGQRLGVMLAELAEAGGLDTDALSRRLAARELPLPMIGRVTMASPYAGWRAETTLDPQAQPFLHDHQFEGQPLLPGVMGIEAFAELASLAAEGDTPRQVTGLENVQFLSPFKYYRGQPRTFSLEAHAGPAQDGTGLDPELVVRAALTSVKDLPARADGPAADAAEPAVSRGETKLHFTADVRLGARRPEPPAISFDPPAAGDLPIAAADIYPIYFHGPSFQVLERVGLSGDTAVGLMAADLPPATSPARVALYTAPRLVELCFQTAGIWLIAGRETMALPQAIESLAIYRQPDEAAGRRLYALVTARNDGARFDAQVVDEAGHVYLVMTGYRTVQIPGSVRLGS